MEGDPKDRKVHVPEVLIPRGGGGYRYGGGLPPFSGGYVYFRPPPPERRWINYTLFAVTFITTLLAGAGQKGVTSSALAAHPLLIQHGLPFSLTLMGILLAHEMGHYFMAKRHGVDATLPYFIPVPLGIVGTFGAVIKMRSPLKSRDALIDIGAAGPIAGMLVAIPVSYIGLVLSDVKPVADAAGGFTLGDSLIFKFFQLMIHGRMKAGFDVFLHPVAFAGWIGMLVTMLNLLPVGQLDGGHISYAVLGPRAIWVSRAAFALLLVLSVVSWPGWLMWAILLVFVIKLRHPPIYEAAPMPIDRKRMVMAWSALVLFILTFIPSPMSGL